MFLAEAGEKQLLEVLPIIFLVFAYTDDAILDDVGHNHFCFLFDFYPYSMGKRKMLHELRRKNALIIIICCKMIIFGPKFREY